MNELVSYVIPVYNAEAYIEKCVKSVCGQTHQEYEVILINDGSKDNSWNLLTEMAKQNERLRIFTQDNHGVSYTRNRGIQLARGKYIQFVDSDDVIDCRMTETMLRKMLQEDLDLCLCRFRFANQTVDNSLEAFAGPIDDMMMEHFVPLMKQWLFQGPCNKLYKAEVIREHGLLFPEEYAKLEDSIFNAMYVNNSRRIGFVPEAFYFYNDDNQESLSKVLNMQEMEAILCFYRTLLAKESIAEEYRKKALGYAVEQIEILYRVSWLKCRQEKNYYRKVWSAFQTAFYNGKGSELLKPYTKEIGMRYKWFWKCLEANSLGQMLLYFVCIESMKKVYHLIRK